MIHYSDFRLDSRIQRLAGALAGRGDEVHAIGVGAADRIVVGDGAIVVHALSGDRRRGGPRELMTGYARFAGAAARRVTALHRRHGLDVVEAHNMPDALVAAGLLPRLGGVPLMLNVHDTMPELYETRFGQRGARLARIEERLSAALADVVIVVTDEARRRLESRGVGVGRTVVVMNSPDEAVFGPPRPPVRPPAEGALTAIYHGGLPERFGVETLIRAMGRLGERVPRLRLRVLGSGDERDALAELARQVAPGTVTVAEHAVPFAQIPGELAAAHIGVVPTARDAFTELLLPVKLLEYVQMGLPVVCSRLPAIERYFDEQEICFAEPGSPDAFADALQELCERPRAATERAERATRRLAGIRWETQRRRYLDTVDRVVTARPAGELPVPRQAAAWTMRRSARATASA
jgi:glycosyltransferase involved in cell wall biosynthesis